MKACSVIFVIGFATADRPSIFFVDFLLPSCLFYEGQLTSVCLLLIPSLVHIHTNTNTLCLRLLLQTTTTLAAVAAATAWACSTAAPSPPTSTTITAAAAAARNNRVRQAFLTSTCSSKRLNGRWKWNRCEIPSTGSSCKTAKAWTDFAWRVRILSNCK